MRKRDTIAIYRRPERVDRKKWRWSGIDVLRRYYFNKQRGELRCWRYKSRRKREHGSKYLTTKETNWISW